MLYLVGGGYELPCVAEDEEPADVERDGGQLLLAALVDLTLRRRPLCIEKGGGGTGGVRAESC